MHLELTSRGRVQALAPLTLAVLALAGCGGGGGSDAPAQPATQSVSGQVIDGAIQGATVCLDLNKNGACDSGEPKSGLTDAQGHYTIDGLTAAQLASGAPLLAVVPAGAVDAVNGTVDQAYALSTPASKPGVISPITHLVQAGVAAGLTIGDAEAAVARQLQVQTSSLYNNYVGATSGDNAALAAVVPTLVASLKAGETPDVAVPTSGTPSYTVRTFNFTDANNYYLRYFYSDNAVDASTGLVKWYDKRGGKSGGIELTGTQVYDATLYGTAQGWMTMNADRVNTSSTGSPSVSTWATGYSYVSTRVDVDVSGQRIADVLRQAQDLSTNTVSTVLNLNPDSVAGTMPAGAKLRKITSVETASPVAYRESDGYIGKTGVISLDTMIAAFPVPTTTVGTSNSVSMGGLHGSAGCGSTVCTQERLRAAFAASGNGVTYYLCDIDTSTGVQSNCTVQGTGTYTKGLAADGVTPVMSFAGLPAPASVQTFTRVFVERNGHVYFGFKDKFVTSKQTRLNKVAFEALAAALGIVPPVVGTSSASPFAGTWNASYTGSDTGSCTSLTIDSTGLISGTCVSTGVGGSFAVLGTVADNGTASFTVGTTSSGATFSGSFSGSSGSGTWTWASHSGSGNWTASKH